MCIGRQRDKRSNMRRKKMKDINSVGQQSAKYRSRRDKNFGCHGTRGNKTTWDYSVLEDCGTRLGPKGKVKRANSLQGNTQNDVLSTGVAGLYCGRTE